MKIFRNRMPKIWLSVIALGVLFLGFAGATAKASDNQTGGFFGLTAVSEYLFGTSTAMVGETLSFSTAVYTAGEGDGTVEIIVNRAGSTTDVVSVTVFTTDGTATGAGACNLNNGTQDYIAIPPTVLTFQQGVTQQRFNVTICNDTVFEPNPNPETFNINLVNPTNGAVIGSPSAAIVQINDNDAAVPGTIGFASPTAMVNEAAGTLTLTVNRQNGSNGTVSASYTFVNETAIGGAACTAGVDFINTPGTVTFGNNQTTATITVVICDDSFFEGNPNETFSVVLSAPTGGSTITGGASTVRVTIMDDDANVPGTLNFSTTGPNSATPTVREGTPGNNTVLTLTVRRSVGTDGSITAQVRFADGTATGGASCDGTVDFINTGQTISFAPQQTTTTITVTICDDNIDETPQSNTAGETFQVILGPGFTSNGPPVLFGANSTSTVTILDTDNGIFQFDTAGPVIVNEGAGFVQVNVQRVAGVQGSVTVNYVPFIAPETPAAQDAIGGATCTGNVDYINTPGTLSFAPGVTQLSFLITICDDSVFETGASGTGAVQREVFRVRLEAPTGGALLATDGLTTTNQTAGVVDQRVEIQDNDTVDNPGTISLNAGSTQSVDEGAGGVGTNTTVTLTVTRSGNGTALDGNATVAFTTSGSATGGASCATAGVDYTPASGTFTFPSNANGAATTQTATVTFTICNDTLFEGTESFTVQLGTINSTPGSTPTLVGGSSSATITILDDDANAGTVTIQATGPTVSEAAGTATITVTRTSTAGGNNGAVTIGYSLTDGTATGGASCGTAGVDYINTPGTVSFPDSGAGGSTSQTATISVTICNDAIDEANTETFQVTLGAPTTGGPTIGTPFSTTVTILDDENGTIQFSAATFEVNEAAGTATITITRTNTTGQVTVDYVFSGGTATGGASCGTAGVDFIDPPGQQTLTFANGVTQQSFTITICNDALDELSPETVNLTLSNPNSVPPNNGNGSPILGTVFQGVLNIIDDDATPALTITPVVAQFQEGNAGTTNYVFNVNISAVSGQTVTANFAVSGGTATGGAACTAGVDYITPANGTVTFAAGSVATQTITVVVCGDLNVEPDETFNVVLSGITNSTPSTVTAVGTILNDDGTLGTIGFGGPGINAPGDVRVVEGNSGTTTATVSVQLTGNPNAQNVTVNFAVTSTGGTATGGATCAAGVDYIIPANGTLTFNAAGTTTQTFTIQVCGDVVKEANEFFFVNLSSAAGNASIADTQAVVIIVDDDKARVADFDRDLRTDFSVFRPSNGFWYILQSINNLPRAQQFGTSTDIITPGDYDNDGATDLAYYRPSTGTFFILGSSNSIPQQIQLGAMGDIPAQGDYDGDGDTDPAVFRPSNGTFFTSTNPATNFGAIQFGQTGDIPVQGDYDGDGRTDVAVYRNGTWFVLRSTLGFFGIQYGQAGDRPIVGDYDGDGRIDFTVYRPSGNPGLTGGVFFSFRSLTNASTAFVFGATEDIPTSGDYDGDGTTDISVWRPSNGTFFFVRSSNGTVGGQQWGQSGDIPVPSRYQGTASTPTP